MVNITDLEAGQAELRGELNRTSEDLSVARLDAQKWKAKYDAAQNELAAQPQSSGLPPELLRKFIAIAQAGGPWELGPGGNLKTSSDILFDSGKIDLKPQGQQALQEIAGKLKEILTDKRVMLRVDGHTDGQPIKLSGWKDNLHLSLMRARAVVAYLASQGIPAEAMCAAGFGEFHPVADNTSREGMSKNRRVELLLMSIGPRAEIEK